MRDKLKRVRESKGLSQKELSEKVAMEQTTYSRKENGISKITDNEWIRLAIALDVPKVEIIDNCEPLNTIAPNSNLEYVSIPKVILDTLIKNNKKLEEDSKFHQQELIELKEELNRSK